MGREKYGEGTVRNNLCLVLWLSMIQAHWGLVMRLLLLFSYKVHIFTEIKRVFLQNWAHETDNRLQWLLYHIQGCGGQNKTRVDFWSQCCLLLLHYLWATRHWGVSNRKNIYQYIIYEAFCKIFFLIRKCHKHKRFNCSYYPMSCLDKWDLSWFTLHSRLTPPWESLKKQTKQRIYLYFYLVKACTAALGSVFPFFF